MLNLFSNKFLLVKGKYGLGNRILALCEAFIYAEITKRILIIDCRDQRYSDTRTNSFSALFSSPFYDPSLKLPKTQSVVPEVWAGFLDLNIESMLGRVEPVSSKRDSQKLLSIKADNIDYNQKVVVMFDYTFHWNYFSSHLSLIPSHWPSDNVAGLLRFLLKSYLIPRPEIASAVKNFKQRNFKSPTIGVHMRYTDNILENKGRIQPIEDYPIAIETLLRSVPDATIYLATDNEDIELEYLRKYKNVLVMPKHYPDKKGQALHSASSCDDRLLIAREALTELYLLSECDYMIYSCRSTFALIASLLSDSPRENLIDLCPEDERNKFWKY
jgi:hypothetical protein